MHCFVLGKDKVVGNEKDRGKGMHSKSLFSLIYG